MSNVLKQLGVLSILLVIGTVNTESRKEGDMSQDISYCDVTYLDHRDETHVSGNTTIIPGITVKNANCCGNVRYSQDAQMCCNEKLYDNAPDLMCCGNEKINVKYEVCPAKKITTNDDLTLCGKDYYHSLYRMCCGKTTYPIEDHMQCCDAFVHDKRTSTCIDGKIIPPWMKCCGGFSINSSHQLCCDYGSDGYFPVDRSGLDDDRCCKTDGRTFHSVTHECGPYGVERRRLLLSHCGKQAYDPVRDICCDGFVYKGGKTRGLQCRDIIRPTPPAHVIDYLSCTGQCPICSITEVHQMYRCPFHAFIAKRIRKLKHRRGGHRRYMVTSDLITFGDVDGDRQRIFKFSQNCKSCVPRSRSIIIITSSSINTFCIVKNTKTNRKYLRKICN
ncbi:galaxin-like [Pecten maximus]|uniref:galaxin-like n=1 Tax=Pecten maximus TaxID=6579 RepID=UPI0014584B53|nr:galaxin-like [Pecten maximus]